MQNMQNNVICQKELSDEAGRPIELQYELLSPGTAEQYGLRIRMRYCGKEETAQLGEVAGDAARARSLLQTLADGGVTPVTLADVLYELL